MEIIYHWHSLKRKKVKVLHYSIINHYKDMKDKAYHGTEGESLRSDDWV